jgi:hypothetical protein
MLGLLVLKVNALARADQIGYPIRHADGGEDAFPELQPLSQVFANLVPTERIQVDERPLERISRR